MGVRRDRKDEPGLRWRGSQRLYDRLNPSPLQALLDLLIGDGRVARADAKVSSGDQHHHRRLPDVRLSPLALVSRRFPLNVLNQVKLARFVDLHAGVAAQEC